ncbi:MAG: recombinase family protein [Lachnospiraceae bacterium]|nr:recombinase family protein [Lachnospiraceae bacterium]
MVYGYCRISTPKQSIERQVRNIMKAYPDAHIVREVFTGTKFQGRKEFEKLYKAAQPGDTIIFDEVSRMSRTAEEGFTLYKELFNKGINLIFLKEPHINTATYKQSMEAQLNLSLKSGDQATDELMKTILDALNRYILTLAQKQILFAFEQSEKEVQDLRRRTREGLETAKLNGKQVGQRKGERLTTKKSIQAKELILKHSRDFNGSLNDNDCIKLIGISRKTYYKYKRELVQA